MRRPDYLDELGEVTTQQWEFLLTRCDQPPFGLPGPSCVAIAYRREMVALLRDMRRGRPLGPTLHDAHIGAVGGE